jgi:hypothetical protein
MTLEGLNPDFRDLLIQFADRGVEFVIVGAYALAVHGAPRASGDIDLFVRPSPPNAQRVYDALRRFGAPLDAARVRPADFAEEGTVYQIGLPPRRIDLMTQITGVSFDEAWSSRTILQLEGRAVSCIGRSALVKNKEATGRPQDLADVARLRRTEPRR